MVQDRFGRTIDYLRISVTERCNLRCTYCMPDDARFSAREDLLTAEELGVVVRGAVDLGFRKFRLTGGEPTVRPDLLEVVETIASVPGVHDLSLTTNGMRLRELARPLRAAGLRRVNVHLDALAPARLGELMRHSRLATIWDGIEAAEEAGLLPMKLNAVVVRGANEDDVPALARLTLDRPWHVRFIELMPFGEGSCARVAREGFVSSDATRQKIEESLGPLEPLAPEQDDECRNFRLLGAPGVIGFISPVSNPYCGSCRRMRLTADGRFHLCLLRDDELSVRDALREAADPSTRADRVRRVLAAAVALKPVGHQLEEGLSTRGRHMHAIGG